MAAQGEAAPAQAADDAPSAAGRTAGAGAGAGAGAAAVAGSGARQPVQLQILNTEERSSMLKSFTVYIIQISDFGRSYQVERRFDDFAKLHADLAEVDSSVPPIPEKKMWASTDASTVAERRPAFERILRHALRSELIVMEKTQAIWKFLEMAPAGIVAARYVFKSAMRLTYARQCGKLLDPKHEKEHAYRLAHEALIKTNLQLLAAELAAAPSGAAAPASAAIGAEPATASSSSSSPAGGAGGETGGAPSSGAEGGLEASSTSPAQGADGGAEGPSPLPGAAATASASAPQEAEAAALEMLRWALANGGEKARRAFLEESGLSAMLTLLFKKGREEGVKSDSVPSPQIRTVLNALVKASGDKYPEVFGQFLAGGGVSLLSAARDVFQRSQAYSEFIAKLLWISWDVETQRAFLQGAHDREALGLLSALFECPSRTARACAGLLLSSLLASQLLEGKDAQAAAGVWSLVEELVAASPAWTGPGGGGDQAGAGAGAGAEEKDKSESDLMAFIQTLAQSEDRMARILRCADAPWRLNGGNLPDEECPLWASSAFALWTLLKLRPKPDRVASLRIALPAVCQAAPARVRWLAGELLLMLQLQSPSQLHGGGGGGGRAGGQFGDIDAVVELTFQESAALEATLREQVEHTRHSLRSELEQNQEVISSQRRLTEERQRELLLAKTPWHRPLDGALKELSATREQLVGALGTTEARSERALSAIRDVLQLELGADGADGATDDRDLAVKLDGMREVEASYLTKKQELDQCQELQTQRDQIAEDANAAMERADKAVQDARRQVLDLETQISTKQREVQSQRTLATSDFSALKGQLMAEMDTIKAKQAKLRERAMKVQNGEPVDGKGVPLDAAAAAEEMARLKKESGQLKARNDELKAEQARMDVDPASLEQQARASEEAVQRLGFERDALRDSLHGLEAEHSGAREAWQSAMTELQFARQQRSAVERECSGLRQQLDSIWASWQPLHARRLQAWRGRILALAQAQRGGRRLVEAVGSGWDGLRNERTQRMEALAVVQELQGQLAQLAEELLVEGDQLLD